MKHNRLVVMMEIAMMTGLAVILDFVRVAQMPFGGSITLAAVPLILLAFRRGAGAGITAGVIFGIINWMIGGYVVHWAQMLLDYPVAFGVLGTAGFFAFKRSWTLKRKLTAVIAGTIVANLLRLASHFTAGVVWFRELAPDGMSPELYSFLYNIAYIGPIIVITILIMVLIVRTGERLFHPETS
ncbi:energy-coupled thiamine transporter ThiT [Alkalicoccus urumqiensis]|uniref:Energy-coupled thiamine transporter ThiT n=1 Tax=Alkalicoccus urumqiensis TaxID=1548213 RepID=A0A2P6MG87_ALKUR|nr:energy-coupled thiamine transporter ThiT [Alkalicoccus urumqiensis]PRO65273.1 energy-coupled thiamine transporter ThiT [Alkalicoccus urumqiensis]